MDVIDLKREARKRDNNKRLAFEWDHPEEIRDEFSALVEKDPTWVYEACGENTNEQLAKAGVALANEQFDEVGRLLAPTMHAYLWKQAVKRVEQRYAEENPLSTADPDLVS